MSDDSRKAFVLATTSNYFGVSSADASIVDLTTSTALNSFLDDGNVPLLAARREGAKKIGLSNKIRPPNETGVVDDANLLVFFKLRPTVVTPDNVHSNVFVSSMLDDSPASSLYHAVRRVYAPLLLQDDAYSRNFDPKLQNLLGELEAGLGSVIRRQGKKSSRVADENASLGGILTPVDEFQYWVESSVSGSKLDARERAAHFRELLQTMAKDFASVGERALVDAVELVEVTQDTLDEVWKQTDFEPPYPERRMVRLMDVVGGALCCFVQRQLGELDFWRGPYHAVKESLAMGQMVCEKWASAVEQLTGQMWKRYGPHPWKGEKYSAEGVQQFGRRLEEISTLRTVHEHLVRLLSSQESDELRTSEAFSAFSGLNPLQYNPYTQPLWTAAVSQYERLMAPAESRIAGKLRRQFRDIKASAHQLLREFQRFKELIKRPKISTELASERETLLGQLAAYVKSMRDDYSVHSGSGAASLSSNETRDSVSAAKGKNLSDVVNNVVFARQMEAKVKDTLETAEQLLNDLAGFKAFRREALELQDELDAYQRDQFDNWSRSTQAAIDNRKDPLGLETTGRLMELGHKDRKLRVFYSDRLVTLVREVRQLAALGFTIPAKIQHTANTASKFQKHGIILKQVAHFYNTIDQQMIVSQQPMMIDSAKAFEAVIRNPKEGAVDKGDRVQITWDDPQELERYIGRLQAVADKLMTENRRLRKCHAVIGDKVVQLMNIDLLRQKQKWKDILLDIRQIMASLVQQGFDPSCMKLWKSHWDHQLYKALEHQYQMGLETLNENLPEIKVEVVFQQQRLQFRPPFEEIKAKYYREMKKFMCIPFHFNGVSVISQKSGSATSTIFSAMVDRNAKSFHAVYRKAEALFRRLVAALDIFRDWVILGQIDLEALVDEQLETVQDWEKNFRELKAKGREAEKLPSSIKVDCVVVSTVPVKATIDDHIQRLYDSLLSSLRRSITLNVQSIDTFLSGAVDDLSTRPQSVEEIGKANQLHTELSSRRPQIKPLFERAEMKNKLLRSVAGGGSEQLAQLHTRWDKFELMLESHEMMVREQVDSMKAGVESKVNAFHQNMEKFSARWHQLKPKDVDLDRDDKALQDSVVSLKERRAEFDELQETMKSIEAECMHFGMTKPDFSLAEEIRSDLEQHEEMWKMFEDFHSGLEEMTKEDWISFRTKSYLFDEFLASWFEKMRAKEPTTMTVRLTRDVEKFQELAPLLKYVRGDVLSPEHWMELFHLVGLPRGTSLDKLAFSDILSVSDVIVAKSSEIKELNSRAQGEVSIRDALRELDMWGAGTVFTLTDYSDTNAKTLKLIKDWRDLVNQVGDNQCLLQTLKDSPYYKGFADKASLWESKLADLDEYLHNLNQIQRKWVYLEPIFGRGALPREQGRFRRVDDDFRLIMIDIAKDNRVLSLVARPGLRNVLIQLLDQLQRCQKSLNEFLEEKRSAFPRFYFIGDDDLLEILGQATNPAVIQSHLKKLFAGIHSVEFDQEHAHIVAMKSLEGEVVPLKRPVVITTEVEVWLQLLADEMKDTLKEMLFECLSAGKRGNAVNPADFPSQILCLAEGIQFTERCEAAIRGRSLAEFQIEMEGQLENYTTTDVSSSSGDRDAATVVLELKLKALILDTVHNIDVVQKLISSETKSVDEWTWQKQLRFYADKKTCLLRMCDAEFFYTFEYQGNAPKLVHTPLTDKCYLTLTQGMHMGLGGNPYGPAGTGKTESVKALGGLFGRQVLVFNCDEGIDVKSMGRIFIGLVKCGAWGCFDEFNRLEEAVLSAVSMQIQTIQAALKSRTAQTELLGRQVDINPNSGIFITLNPAGKGYGGRQKLPDNLKQLFRPVAMSRPDNELIAEVILFSDGFKEAKVLGRRLVAIFNISKEMLSVQQHYDWGLRALKTVLKGAGTLLQNCRHSGTDIDAKVEARLIVQALRVNTLSKLTFSDAKRFDSLVRDVFPDVPFRDIEYEKLEAALRAACEESNLTIIKSQVCKALELYEQLRQRMGVVVVGPSGSGKSTLWRILHLALEKIGQSLKQYTVNPKAMPRTQLLGHIDMDTREWSDGVLTYSARQVVKEPVDVHSWIVCDGDIDPEWIESLNSVLDDNRLLTMPSGERIQFGPNVNFIFETHDLTSASPATISRMGMIFLSDEDTDVKAVVSQWLRNQPEEDRKRLEGWLEDYFDKALEWVLKQNDFVVETTLVGTALNGLSHLRGVRTKGEFACALIRGLGGNLKPSAFANLAKEIFHLTHEMAPDQKRPQDTYYDEQSGRLRTYQMEIPDDLRVNDFSSGSLPVILTVDVQRSLDLFWAWLQPDNKQPFVLVGPEGCGKSLLLHHCFEKLRSTQVAVIHCTAQTTAVHVLQKLSQTCMVISSNTGRVYRPKDCERLILYLKDVNLPKPDKWGTSQLIAFLQQVLTYKGFYDSNLEFVGLDGVQIVASMNPGSTMGRHLLTTRFTSVVRLCSIGYPDHDQLHAVYGAYLKPILHRTLLSHPVWGSTAKVHALALSMVSVYEQLRSKFTIDDHSHYVFTPRDLTDWTLGFLRYDQAAAAASAGSESDRLLEIWAYEARRLFRDRLVGRDVDKFDAVLASSLLSDWAMDQSRISTNDVYYVTWGTTAAGSSAGKAGRQLGRLVTDDFQEIAAKALTSYARENSALNILIFKEVLNHLARVDRVLTKPGGSLLLAGRSGVGRRTAVALVCHMHQLQLYTPKLSRGYSLKHFKNDLKTVVQTTGIDGNQLVLLLEDHQFIDPAFLEMVNSLLSAGEVPGLYTPEELEPLLATIRDAAAQENFRGSLFAYFARRVQANLHVVVVMDSSSPDFVKNCESNPAFYTRCSFQAMESWSRESMLLVPSIALQQAAKTRAEGVHWSEKEMKRLPKHFLAIHESCADAGNGATPRRYVTFLDTFKAVYSRKRHGVQKKQSHLQAGVAKLNEAKELVDSLKHKAAEQSHLLAEKQNEADAALKEITINMAKASEQKSEMEVLKQKLSEESLKLEQRKKAIDIELSEIEPAVREAQQAVGNIKSESLSEIRSLRAPPDVIRDILEGVLRLMGIYDTSWNSMKSFLAKRGVKEEIINFDVRNVTPELRQGVSELLEKNKRSFEEKVAKRASAAAAPLAVWLKANIRYSEVLEKIEPLETEQAALQKNMQRSQAKLEKLRQALDLVDKKVAGMRDTFETRTTEAARLRVELEKAQETIAAAETLVGKLKGEHKRWSGQVLELTAELEHLPERALLAAGFITYLGAAPEDLRRRKVELWKQTLEVDEFDLKRFLSTESELLCWKAEGLPSDDLSMENALVILQSSSRPFLVDPSQRATEWLKTHLKDARLEVVNQQDGNFSTSLELSVRFGKTLIIQEMDTIEPILYPLLRGDLISQGPRFAVQLGEKVVEYAEDFKLFMTTRSPNLEIPPFASSIVTEVNFTTTRAGLAGQLLAMTIQNEKPGLEVRKTELLRTEEELKVQLAALEESLLEELASAEGNILENKSLLQSLNETKAKSSTIAESLEESVRLQKSLDEERDAYLPLAENGSRLFFVISDLAKMNNMYRFSLASFLRLFHRALKTKQENTTTELRIKFLISTLQTLVYEYVCRSLFKADRLMFALHLVHGMHPELFAEQEWEAFTGQIVSDVLRRQESLKSLKESLPTWIDLERVAAVNLIKTVFKSLFSSLLLHDADLWANFARSSQCEIDIPPTVLQKITLFQQILVIQALRPDRLQSAMELFACRGLGMKQLSLSTFSLKRLYENETLPNEPILIVISPGADPSQELQELADETIGGDRYHQVAMGQGQADIALQLLRDCARDGHWLCLKNLHLVTAWLPQLEKELNSLEPSESFRLWLTAEVHPKFPAILLQSSLKVTYEAPPGIRRNLMRTYDSWTPEFVSRGKSVARSQALFALSWFHAIVQERRSYIPQGWTKFYEFSLGDLRAASEVIDRLFAEAGTKPIQWEFVHGLLVNAVYGGRVDNTFDLRVLASYLRQYFNNETLGSEKSRRKRLGGAVAFPTSYQYKDFVALIQSLPDSDKPSFFGLPANIERSAQRSISSQVISQLKILMRADLAADKFDKEKWALQLQPILSLWKKLNQGTDLVNKKLPPLAEKSNATPPVLLFVTNERYSALKLMQQVHASLSALNKVIRGTTLVTPAVQKLAASLLHHQVPEAWSTLWNGPDDPVHYLRSLVAKSLALGSWVEKAENGTLLTASALDLSELFHPDTFLNALRQQAARNLKCSMDDLKFVCSWRTSDTRGAVTVKIEGLQLEGCTFDGARLTDNQRDSPSVSAIPPCCFAWVSKDAPEPYLASDCISLPIYYSAEREHIVTRLNVPCGGDQDHWIQSGAALFLKNQ
ncbi:cytoplasmic dynein 2 heavy chain 1-like isoform X2 [Oscarella lobularis]|uniref:cytoplasmic dynein 2 heavy chain 1-like isoform X2 n=1 Tax=Oscarella lobularis TaxID=121494 RepID=UPI003313632E